MLSGRFTPGGPDRRVLDEPQRFQAAIALTLPSGWTSYGFVDTPGRAQMLLECRLKKQMSRLTTREYLALVADLASSNRESANSPDGALIAMIRSREISPRFWKVRMAPTRHDRFGDYQLDADRREFRFRGKRVLLEPKTFDVLAHLVSRRGQIVSVEDLLRIAWPNVAVGRGSVHRAIRLLRKAFSRMSDAEESESPDLVIETLPRRGYRLTGDIEEFREPVTSAKEGPRYIGRHALRAELNARLDRALAGETGLLLLHGSAGIGKSATLAHVARCAEGVGAMVLAGRSVEGPAAPPYRPWSRILRASIARTGPERLAEDLGYAAVDVVRALPELADVLGIRTAGTQEVDPGARYRVHDAIAQWLEKACVRQPLVLLFDDLNRADLDSIRLLGFLIQELTDCRLLLVAAFRDGSHLDAGREALGEIMALCPDADLPMVELTTEEVREFALTKMSEDWTESRLEQLVDLSGGNPLFVEQILRTDSQIPLETVSMAPGPGLQAVLQRLVGDASSFCSDVLGFASVFGREFNPILISAGLDRPLADVQRAIEEAIRLRIVEPGDDEFEIRFVHGLLPEIVYGRLGLTNRAELHRLAVHGILATRVGASESLAELAHHSKEAASVNGIGRAFEFGIAAAQDAASRLGYEDAVSLFERTLDLRGEGAPEAIERAACLIQLGELMVMTGRGSEARAHYAKAQELARQEDDAVLFAHAALGPSHVDEYNQGDDQQAEILLEAIEVLGDRDPQVRIQLLISYSLTGYFADRDRTLSASAEALMLARTLGDPTFLCGSLLARAEALGWKRDRTERRQHLREALELARSDSVRPIERGRALQRAAAEALEAGDSNGFEASLECLILHARENRLSYFDWSIASMRGSRAIFEGRFDEGRALIEEQIKFGARSHPGLSIAVVGVQHASISLAVEDPAKIAAGLAPLVEQAPEMSALRQSLALTLAQSGDFEGANRHVEVLIGNDFEPRHKDFLGTLLALLAETVQLTGRRDLAKIIAHELAGVEERCVVVGICLTYYGAIDRYRGLCAETMGDMDAAIRFFEKGLVVDEELRAQPFVARGLSDLARTLRARGMVGDLERADRIFERAVDLTERLGMGPLAARIREQRALRLVG